MLHTRSTLRLCAEPRGVTAADIHSFDFRLKK
jgi:hypothetical protein